MSRGFNALIPALFAWLFITTPAAACPNPELPAAKQLRENGGSLRRGKATRIFAGGSTQIADCSQLGLPADAKGTFADAPSLHASFLGMMGLAAELTVNSQCPTALLIRTDDGTWYFDDDGKGQGIPRLMLSRPGSGDVDVWVGTVDGQTCRGRVGVVTYLRN